MMYFTDDDKLFLATALPEAHMSNLIQYIESTSIRSKKSIFTLKYM